MADNVLYGILFFFGAVFGFMVGSFNTPPLTLKKQGYICDLKVNATSVSNFSLYEHCIKYIDLEKDIR